MDEGNVMARNRQTDSSDKRHKKRRQRARKPVMEGFWSFCLMPCLGVNSTTLLAWSMSGFLSDFYRRVDRLLARVETVQWAEGTR